MEYADFRSLGDQPEGVTIGATAEALRALISVRRQDKQVAWPLVALAQTAAEVGPPAVLTASAAGANTAVPPARMANTAVTRIARATVRLLGEGGGGRGGDRQTP